MRAHCVTRTQHTCTACAHAVSLSHIACPQYARCHGQATCACACAADQHATAQKPGEDLLAIYGVMMSKPLWQQRNGSDFAFFQVGAVPTFCTLAGPPASDSSDAEYAFCLGKVPMYPIVVAHIHSNSPQNLT